MQDYGLLLKTVREARGMTQEQASDAVGVSVDSWYAYEANLRLPPMRFHDLRDTAVKLMLANGVNPKTLQ